MFSALTSTLYALWRDLSTDPFSSYLPQGYASTARLPSYPTSSPITMEFTPSPYDVQRTRLLLHRGIGVPVEIADLIIDAAQYWPAATGTTTAVGPAVLHPAGPGRGRQGEVLARRSRSAIVRASDTGRNKAAQLVVVTGAVPGDGSLGGRGRGWEGLRKVKVRSMKWWLKSRDQGWVSEGSATTGKSQFIPSISGPSEYSKVIGHLSRTPQHAWRLGYGCFERAWIKIHAVQTSR